MIVSKSFGEKYRAKISNGSAILHADVAEEKGGQGNGFRPHDLIEAGYAACLSITARMALDRMGVDYDGVTVEVSLDRSVEDQAVFRWRLDITGDVGEDVKRAVRRTVAKCPVNRTLSRSLSFLNVDGKEQESGK